MADDERVSLAEIVEVRDTGFNSAELLAIIYASCEHLLTKQITTKKGLFSPSHIYITNQGRIQIEFLESVLLDYVPPELHASSNSSVNDPQIVWNLGEIARHVSQADCADADLFSLINVMTVNHEPTRPTIPRLLQMAKNKIANPDGVPKLLTLLFQEVMGDIEELVDGSDLECLTPANESAPTFVTKVAQITHASTSVSSTPTVSVTSHSEFQSLSSSDEGSLVESKENVEFSGMSNQKQDAVPNQTKQAIIELVDDTSSLSKISEESPHSSIISTPNSEKSRDDVQMAFSAQAHSPIGPYNPFDSPEELENKPMHVSTPKDDTYPIIDSTQTLNYFKNRETIISNSRTNSEPVEVEIHRESSRPSTPVRSEQSLDIRPKIEKTPMSARRRSSGVATLIEHEKDSVNKPSSVTQSVSMVTYPQSPVLPSFSRHNSLQSNQIRRHSTARRNRKTTSIPEFVEKRSLPMIRLRAQSQKRRRMSLLRVEDTLVLIKLLNGQSVELNCRSDVLVINIFDTIVAHLNITEHSFFGLAILKGSEFYFLDNEQRLEKFAPPGWKTIVKNRNTPNFSLYLRFKFYPKRTEFVRNEVTMHLLYLQLRQDILSGILIAPKQHLLEAGSLALQAEFSDKPQHVTEYFDIHNYLPNSMLAGLRAESLKNIQNSLVQLHSTHAGSNRRHSERLFIQLAQTFPCFGAHFYAVYKFKPPKKQERGSLINDIQNIQLVAIMPRGIGICKNATLLQVNSTFEWQFIRTLQYDGKRFLIASIENNIAIDHVFYTDHFTKSRYLVRFAADQHKFMLRMRNWQLTLTQSRMPAKDVGVDEDDVVDPVSSNQISRQHRRSNKRQDLEMTSEYIGSCYGSDAVRLSVVLEKHPAQGLGLTLVDGSVNGIKGVYVKSVAPEGDGRRKGLQVGDCILKISGVSLFNKTRHDAVDLVKDCSREVHLEVLRFHSITAVLGETTATVSPTPAQSASSAHVTSPQELSTRKDPKTNNVEAKKSWPASKFPDDLSSSPTERSRTPPPQRKTQSSSAILIQKRQRAVSDFGAIGDTLPKMSSDYLLASMEKLSKPADSDLSEDENGNDDADKSGAYSVNEIYNFHRDDELDIHQANGSNTFLNFSDSRGEAPASERNGNLYQQRSKSRSDVKPSDRMNGGIRAVIEKTKNGNLDWTHDLSDIEDGESEEKSEHTSLINIQLNRIPGHSLGFRIASSNGRAYIKQVNSEPAISAKIRTDDRIVSISGQSVEGMNHQEIVNLLRNGGNVVRMVVERIDQLEEEGTKETITVVLDKSKSSSLGLSLAKRMGHQGIFIRNIVSGSLADQEGSLRVGDQIIMLNGEQIENEHPNEIVERLRLIAGAFELVVKRVELN